MLYSMSCVIWDHHPFKTTALCVIFSLLPLCQSEVTQSGSKLDTSFLHKLGLFGITVAEENKENVSIAKVRILRCIYLIRILMV